MEGLIAGGGGAANSTAPSGRRIALRLRISAFEIDCSFADDLVGSITDHGLTNGKEVSRTNFYDFGSFEIPPCYFLVAYFLISHADRLRRSRKRLLRLTSLSVRTIPSLIGISQSQNFQNRG